MTDFAQRTVTAGSPAQLAYEGGGPVLLQNTDPATTVWLGSDPFDVTATGDNVAPLPPLGTAVFDGSGPVYGITASGTALVSVYPGGLNFFQLVNLLVKTLRITGAVGNGVFVYSSAPAAGDLVESITATDATDPFGNPFFHGFTSYSGNGALALFMALRQAGLFWGTNSNGPGGTGALAIAGPVGLRVQNFIVATDPNNAGTNETWHSITTVGGMTINSGGHIVYRLTTDNQVEVEVQNVTTTSQTDGTTVITAANGFAAGYRPLAEKRRGLFYNTAKSTVGAYPDAGFAVQTDGSVQCYGFAASDRIDGQFRYPLDI